MRIRRGAGLSAVTIAKRLRNRMIRHLPLASRICAANRHGHVVMIHIGRSGSTVVGDLLNQHPRIIWDGEVYQRIFEARQRADGSLPPIADIDPVAFVRRRSGKAFGAWYGFEAKFFHLRALGAELPDYLDALEAQLPNLQFVVLERRNRLRTIVSAIAARETGRYHIPVGAAPIRNRVRIDPGSVPFNRTSAPLRDVLEQFDRDFSALFARLRDRRHLHLTYEEDVQHDPKEAYRRICDHLGVVPMRRPRIRYRRTNPAPLSELVSNVDALRAELRGTSYECMLDAS